MTNDDEETVRLFTDVRAWSGQGVRAPHKPLLLLLALARLARERTPTSAALSFEETAPLLARLLREFGPPRSSVRPEYPFWRLQNDAAGAVWQLRSRGRMPTPNRSGDVTAAGLREAKAVGTIPAPLAKKILDRPTLLKTIVEAILDGSWESSLHADILAAVGYPTTPTFEGRRPRNPDFRSLVLRIYEQRCAFCDYDGRLGGNPLAVEAAHVRWHAAGGPDTADNALALCTLHHRAFDAGALGLDAKRRILVSQELSGGPAVTESLLNLRGKRARPPIAESAPSAHHSAWHREQVFRDPAR